MAEQVIDSTGGRRFCHDRSDQLMDFNELAQMDLLRSLFNSFSQKRELLHLLDESMRAKGCRFSSARSPAISRWTTAA